MEIQYPLKEIDDNRDKTAEHWFDHYSVKIQKQGYDTIPLLNKDEVKKHQLIRFRGMILNQMNNEYFDKCCQFRESDDVKQTDETAIKRDISQRYPMVIRTEINQNKWSKDIILGNNPPQLQTDAIIAKFYCHCDSLKICDSIEIYGIWSPKTNKTEENPENQENQENQASTNDKPKDLYAVPSNCYDTLPTMHVLYWKKIEWVNPLISTSTQLHDLNKLFDFYYKNASLIRASLIKYIAEKYVSNDHLLAEYILLNLISKVVSTKNGILLGHFPINIRGALDTYKIKDLYDALTPFALNINLTLKYLNAKRFDPVKNNDTDELETGILQLRQNTAIIIDETLLEAGNLNKIGLQNLESLKTLITEQKVKYDFVYHSIPFDVNSSVLILSKTKPLPQLQTYCHIYCDIVEQNEGKSEGGEEEFALDEYRMYLSICRHLVDQFALNSKDVCKEIEEDWVQLRKTDKETNEETLHHRLLMLRLINSSFLNQTNDDDMMNIFKYMQMLEKKRKLRNDPFKKTVKHTKNTPLNTVAEE